MVGGQRRSRVEEDLETNSIGLSGQMEASILEFLEVMEEDSHESSYVLCI